MLPQWAVKNVKKKLNANETKYITITDKYIQNLISLYNAWSDNYPKDEIKDNERLVLTNIIKIKYYHYLDNTEYILNKVLLVDKCDVGGKTVPVVFIKDSEKLEWNLPKLITKIEEIENR